ncbi:MAG: DUF3187 family protein [Candidatus Brocadiia bacterium]
MRLLLIVLIFIPLSLSAQEVINNPESVEPMSVPESIRMGPMMTSGNNLFHSLVLVPALESARLIEPDRGYISAGLNYDNSQFSKQSPDWLVDYDARLIEGFLDIRYGVSEEIEARVTITGGALFEDAHNLVLSKNSVSYLAGNRGIGPSDMIIGIKYNLTEPELGSAQQLSANALKVSLKMPVADKKDLLSSGGIDLAAAYLGTYQIDEATRVHYQVGYTITGTENVFSHNVNIDNLFFYGAGVSWLMLEDTAIIAQIQGNTTAYDSIKPLKANPLTIHTGMRYSEDGLLFTEGSLGFGLNDSSSGLILMFSVGTAF